MKYLKVISMFIVSLLVIFGTYYLSSSLYTTFIGYNILYGLCSGEGCLGFLPFIALPVAVISAVIFTFLIKAFKKSGVVYSLVILTGLAITPVIISGRAEYLRASGMLEDAIFSMSELDKQISDVAKKEGSKVCFTRFPGEYFTQIGSLPYADGPAVGGISDDKKSYFADGNGITATTYYNRFNLFKLSDVKTISNVHVIIRPIKYTDGFYQSKKVWQQQGNEYSDYREKYMPYVYLDYKNSLELRQEDKTVPRDSAPADLCQGSEIQNGGIKNGKPVIIFSHTYFSN